MLEKMVVRMDKCQKVQESLAQYRTATLRSGNNLLIEEHLKSCLECASELRMLDDVLAMVAANTPQLDPPAGLWNGVYNRISQGQIQRSAIQYWLTRPLRIAGAAVAALALIFVVTFSGSHRSGIPPVIIASNREYIQGHALYAAQVPLADHVSYLSVVAASAKAKQNE